MADRLEITLLVDNYVDIFLPSTERVRYPSPGGGSRLWGEQGLSIWLEVRERGKAMRRLYGFGRTDNVLFHNAEQLGVDIGTADFMVLSHAHGDHHGGLTKALRTAQASCRLVIHPTACGIKRFIKFGENTVGPWGIKKKLLSESHREFSRVMV